MNFPTRLELVRVAKRGARQQILTALFFSAALLAAHLAGAANSVWSGASGVDLSWLTSGNWAASSPPGTNDDALFFDAGTTNDIVSLNSVVTASRTIRALRLGQTNGNHNLYLNAGVTLTVAGTNHNGYGPLGIDPAAGSITNGLSTLFAGPWPGPGVATAVMLTNTISGPGTLAVNNTNNEFIVRYWNGANVVHYAVLDMSQLSTFTAYLGRIGIGYGQPGGTVRAMGRLFLAQTNNITLVGTNFADSVQLVVGSNSGNNDGNSTTAFLHLGRANRLNVDKILVGGQKTPGSVIFNASFPDAFFSLRGSDGIRRVSALRIGDESDSGSSGSPTTGTFNLLGGTSDLLVDSLIVGKGQNGGGNTTAATGNLLVGAGTVDANSLAIGSQANPSQGGTITGTATFSNTTVTVNSLLALGVSLGSPAARVANLNVLGGSMTANGSYKNQGTVSILVSNAILTLPAGAAITANKLQLDGGTLANVGTLKVTNTLTILNNGALAGAPILDLGVNSTPATWDVQAITNGTLTISSTMQGSGTLLGNVLQSPAASINPGGVSAAGALNFSGNLTLNNGGTLNFDLSTNSAGGNDQITVSGTLTANGTNNVFLKSLGGSLDTSAPYTIITSGSLVGDQTHFKVVGPLTTGRYTFAFDTSSQPNNVRLVVGGTGPASQTWVGDGLANIWDAQGAFNWNNGGSSQFFNLDSVTFNDTGSVTPSLSVSGALVTGTMTVNNSVKNYVLGGAGSLSVAGPFNKLGTGGLVLTNLSDNSFSSLLTISNGAVTIANRGQNTFFGGINLAGGALALSGNSTNIIVDPNTGSPVITIGAGTTLSIINSNANTFNGVQVQLDGTLAFNQPVDATFDSPLIDFGTFIKSGPGKLTLSGNNSFFGGQVQINGGTVIAGNTISAIGGGTITIANGAALDLNGKNIGGLPISVSGGGPAGAGALVNNGSPQNTGLTTIATALHNVTLAGNTILGGSGPWSTDPILNLGYFVITETFGTGGTNFSLTKAGGNQVSLMNAIVDPALGNINVQQGMLNFQGSTDTMGNPASNITVSAGATLSFYDTSTAWDKKFVLIGDGVTPSLFNYNGTHTVIGAVALSGICVIGGAPVGRGVPVSLTMRGSVSGSGSLLKPASDSQGTLVLAGTNSYSGTTTVAGGTLLVEGVNLGTNTFTVSGGTLGGVGSIVSPVIIQSAGNLSPGDSSVTYGVLSIGQSLSLGGTNIMDVNKTGATITSDLITNVSTLSFGGTLQLNLTGDPLAKGDSIKLYSFASAHGAFAAIMPDNPGSGLQWDTSHLVSDGTLRVGTLSTTPPSLSVVVSGNQLLLSWPADHTGWRLQAQTNSLSVGLTTNWFEVPGSSASNTFSVPLNPNNPSAFYRLISP